MPEETADAGAIERINPEGSPDNTKMELERVKLEADSMKHITTLATGTIVIVATFMDKLPKPLVQSRLLSLTVLSMLVCILCSFVHLWNNTLVRFARGKSRIHRRMLSTPKGYIRRQVTVEDINFVLINGVYLSFCFGLISLGVFAIMNIQHLA